ncbi:MAG TPA: FMN-binding negative transcriptional regulator [Gemmatimonadaceae bacterium]|nr:FMN-binding negative transcriptional regulator [Gemmatimonadaceae bacterium]
MYTPSSFVEKDLPTLFAFMDAHPLAAVVTDSPPEGLVATHLPLVLDREVGSMGTINGHFARANSQWRCLADGPVPALLIFTGPNAYISPEWYQTKAETGKDVPTWNYVAVHVYGMLRLRDDSQFLRDHLEKLTHRHESGRANPWKLSDAPADYITQQMKGIVGVSLEIERLEGKWKMSQNRADVDIAGVVRGMSASPSPIDQTVAAIVSERRPKR